MPKWEAYMQEQVAKLQLAAQTFEARRGDVFIWNSYLLHGGCPIARPGKTRQSIVFHYYSEEDARALRMRLVPESVARTGFIAPTSAWKASAARPRRGFRSARRSRPSCIRWRTACASASRRG
jgi:hypothetical protein